MQLKEKNSKVLIHTCCAICSGYPIQKLQELGYKPIAYFFNPNIFPEREYNNRLEAQKALCNSLKCELIIEDYIPGRYNEVMQEFQNYEEGSIRCKRCFELRLFRTVQKAKELGINKYTTSISISPHKNLEVINEVGKSLSDYFKIDFIDINFRKQNGLLKTNQISKALNLYRQNYCGCEISLKEIKNFETTTK